MEINLGAVLTEGAVLERLACSSCRPDILARIVSSPPAPKRRIYVVPGLAAALHGVGQHEKGICSRCGSLNPTRGPAEMRSCSDRRVAHRCARDGSRTPAATGSAGCGAGSRARSVLMRNRFVVVGLLGTVLTVACESQGLRSRGASDGAVAADGTAGAGGYAPFTPDSSGGVRSTGGAGGTGGTAWIGTGGAGGSATPIARGGSGSGGIAGANVIAGAAGGRGRGGMISSVGGRGSLTLNDCGGSKQHTELGGERRHDFDH